jgi:hypothetical protein
MIMSSLIGRLRLLACFKFINRRRIYQLPFDRRGRFSKPIGPTARDLGGRPTIIVREKAIVFAGAVEKSQKS